MTVHDLLDVDEGVGEGVGDRCDVLLDPGQAVIIEVLGVQLEPAQSRVDVGPGHARDATASGLGSGAVRKRPGRRSSPGSASPEAARATGLANVRVGATVLHTSGMQTSMRITVATRNALARIAAEELGGVSLEEALRVVLFEHQSRTALARLAADPAAAGSYLAESAALAEIDTPVRE